jgi:hypothetical protein
MELKGRWNERGDGIKGAMKLKGRWNERGDGIKGAMELTGFDGIWSTFIREVLLLAG